MTLFTETLPPADQPYRVPENWVWVRFKDISLNFDGKRVPLKLNDRAVKEKIYPYYGATGIIDYVDHYLFDGTFLLISEDGANLLSRAKDNAFIATGKFWVNNHAHIVKMTDMVLMDHVRNYINSIDLSPFVTGSAQPKLTQSNLNKILIPLPPLPEQRRIAAKLDALLGKLREARTLIDEARESFALRRAAILYKAVTGKLTEGWRKEHPGVKKMKITLSPLSEEHYQKQWRNFMFPESWSCAYLQDIADVRLGKMLDQQKNTGRDVKYLRNVNVRWMGFDLSDIDSLLASDDEIEKLSIHDGDVLICEGGEPGRAATWRMGKHDLIFQKALHRARLRYEIEPEWLVYNLQVDANIKKLDELFTGTTIRHLTGRALAKYPLPLPPVEEQCEIVRQVESLLGHESDAAALLDMDDELDLLEQSLLSRAFRGELGTNDPAESPATG